MVRSTGGERGIWLPDDVRQISRLETGGIGAIISAMARHASPADNLIRRSQENFKILSFSGRTSSDSRRDAVSRPATGQNVLFVDRGFGGAASNSTL
jgi:hypothetical protein